MSQESNTSRRGAGRAALAFGAIGVVVLVVALVGGWLIGLNPGFSIALVVAVMGVAALLLWIRARRTQAATDGNAGSRSIGLGAVVGHTAVAAVVTLGLSQLVPYGRASASNPPVGTEPAWSSPRTRELTVNACYGCHSNQTEWPWYAKVAPMSWAVASHVEEGRSKLNFSEFDQRQREADEAIETIREGSMPPAYFTRLGLHSEAKLTDAEIEELIAGLQATPGLGEDGEDGERENGRD